MALVVVDGKVATWVNFSFSCSAAAAATKCHGHHFPSPSHTCNTQQVEDDGDDCACIL